MQVTHVPTALLRRKGIKDGTAQHIAFNKRPDAATDTTASWPLEGKRAFFRKTHGKSYTENWILKGEATGAGEGGSPCTTPFEIQLFT